MMSSAATAPASPAKSPKKRARSQRKKAGPTLSDLILRAAGASTERGGVSLAALKKALGAAGYDAVRNKARVVSAVKRLVANKSLVQTKGTGASGSFRLSKKPPAPRGRKKKAARKKKPGTRGAKRGASAKTAAAGATPAAKRSPKKRKSPKKAKRPAGAKRARKAKSPKKAKRRVSASTGTRTRTRTRARAAAKK